MLVADGGANGWAVLAAGGSIPKLSRSVDRRVLAAVPRMRPFEPAGLTARQWALAEPGRNYLVYSGGGDPIRLDLSGDRETFTARRIDPRSGQVVGPGETVRGGAIVDLPVPGAAPIVVWLSREGFEGPSLTERGDVQP